MRSCTFNKLFGKEPSNITKMKVDMVDNVLDFIRTCSSWTRISREKKISFGKLR
jgi:hypothetical protein